MTKQINYRTAMALGIQGGTAEAVAYVVTQIQSLAGPDDPEPGQRSPQRRVYAENNAPHFTFLTDRDDVALPQHLLDKFPKAITIVLQYEFSDLQVHDRNFSVVMNFNKQPFKVIIPYDAILQVVDPKQPNAGFAFVRAPVAPPEGAEFLGQVPPPKPEAQEPRPPKPAAPQRPDYVPGQSFDEMMKSFGAKGTKGPGNGDA